MTAWASAGGSGPRACRLWRRGLWRRLEEETEKPFAKKVDGDLVYFNWAEYIDPAVIKSFEKRYGVKVRESYFDSMSAMMSKLRSGIEYDVIFPTAEYVSG